MGGVYGSNSATRTCFNTGECTMSGSVPKFRIGDRVRIMQTDQMVHLGYANQRGLIIAKVLDGFARIELSSNNVVNVPLSCLMHDRLQIFK